LTGTNAKVLKQYYSNKPMNILNHYRKKIDNIDKKIVKLLKSRFEVARQVSNFKKNNKIRIADKKRELEVLSNIKKYSKKHQKFLAGIYKKIISYSKKLQK
jgi:monofunctional chorismate mutase